MSARASTASHFTAFGYAPRLRRHCCVVRAATRVGRAGTLQRALRRARLRAGVVSDVLQHRAHAQQTHRARVASAPRSCSLVHLAVAGSIVCATSKCSERPYLVGTIHLRIQTNEPTRKTIDAHDGHSSNVRSYNELYSSFLLSTSLVDTRITRLHLALRFLGAPRVALHGCRHEQTRRVRMAIEQ